MSGTSMWLVDVAAHTIAGGRYSIAARRVEVPETTPARARLYVLRRAHAAAGVPPWRPYLRESWERATVTAGTMSSAAQRVHDMLAAQAKRDAKANEAARAAAAGR